MEILIYSGSNDLESWLKETFVKQNLTFTKTASGLESNLKDKDLVIVDYQSQMDETLWDLCESGFKGKVALIASSNISKTKKIANTLNNNFGNIEAFNLSSLKGYSAKKVASILGVPYRESIKKEASFDKNFRNNIDRQRKEFQSIYDVLLEKIPSLMLGTGNKFISDKHADSLYEIWKNSSNKIKDDIYFKPIDMKSEQIAEMERAGLVKSEYDKVKITAKGKDVLNVMILGDERSIFDHDGSNPKYVTALSNTNVGQRLKKTGKK